MKLTHLIHATTRPAWTARLVVYIACIVTITSAVQIAVWIWWW